VRIVSAHPRRRRRRRRRETRASDNESVRAARVSEKLQFRQMTISPDPPPLPSPAVAHLPYLPRRLVQPLSLQRCMQNRKHTRGLSHPSAYIHVLCI